MGVRCRFRGAQLHFRGFDRTDDPDNVPSIRTTRRSPGWRSHRPAGTASRRHRPHDRRPAPSPQLTHLAAATTGPCRIRASGCRPVVPQLTVLVPKLSTLAPAPPTLFVPRDPNMTTERPLAGIRVLELGQHRQPLCRHLACLFWRRRHQVEAPDGDPQVAGASLQEGTSLWWRSLSRNKRCITLDLRQPAGKTSRAAWPPPATSSSRTFAPALPGELRHRPR